MDSVHRIAYRILRRRLPRHSKCPIHRVLRLRRLPGGCGSYWQNKLAADDEASLRLSGDPRGLPRPIGLAGKQYVYESSFPVENSSGISVFMKSESTGIAACPTEPADHPKEERQEACLSHLDYLVEHGEYGNRWQPAGQTPGPNRLPSIESFQRLW